MREIQTKVLNKAIAMLQAVGVQYAIVDTNGNKYGTLPIQPAKPKRSPHTYPFGTITKHIKPYIDPLKVGESVAIPIQPFDKGTISSSVSSYCFKLWGKGSHAGTTTKDGKFYEVLRLNQDFQDALASAQKELTPEEQQDKELFEAWL
jgi:hypothetical protein